MGSQATDVEEAEQASAPIARTDELAPAVNHETTPVALAVDEKKEPPVAAPDPNVVLEEPKKTPVTVEETKEPPVGGHLTPVTPVTRPEPTVAVEETKEPPVGGPKSSVAVEQNKKVDMAEVMREKQRPIIAKLIQMRRKKWRRECQSEMDYLEDRFLDQMEEQKRKLAILQSQIAKKTKRHEYLEANFDKMPPILAEAAESSDAPKRPLEETEEKDGKMAKVDDAGLEKKDSDQKQEVEVLSSAEEDSEVEVVGLQSLPKDPSVQVLSSAEESEDSDIQFMGQTLEEDSDFVSEDFETDSEDDYTDSEDEEEALSGHA